jgi:hypothetical protein
MPIRMRAKKSAKKRLQITRTTTSEVFRSLGDQEVAGGVVTLAPFIFKAAFPGKTQFELCAPQQRSDEVRLASRDGQQVSLIGI